MTTSAAPHLTPAQHAWLDVWQKHVLAKFVTKNVPDALDTMTEDAYVNDVPLLLGGLGKEGVRKFYAKYFVAQMPPDIESTLISRTISQDRIAEESVFRFTHSLVMDWLLPGVPLTGRRIEVAVVGIIQFEPCSTVRRTRHAVTPPHHRVHPTGATGAQSNGSGVTE
jgi:carboxymethylenebutenolidase